MPSTQETHSSSSKNIKDNSNYSITCYLNPIKLIKYEDKNIHLIIRKQPQSELNKNNRNGRMNRLAAEIKVF